MDTKLTLKLDKEVIEKAKHYASSRNKSLSRMVESFLKSVVEPSNEDQDDISPFVKSLKTGVSVPADLDHKTDYRDRLEEKYR
ncbi:MAG: DUF6364 family protein [Bacteroidota bacterium]